MCVRAGPAGDTAHHKGVTNMAHRQGQAGRWQVGKKIMGVQGKGQPLFQLKQIIHALAWGITRQGEGGRAPLAGWGKGGNSNKVVNGVGVGKGLGLPKGEGNAKAYTQALQAGKSWSQMAGIFLPTLGGTTTKVVVVVVSQRGHGLSRHTHVLQKAVAACTHRIGGKGGRKWWWGWGRSQQLKLPCSPPVGRA